MRYNVTNPLEVEFSSGRISPYLMRTVSEIEAAWKPAHRADDFSSAEVESDLIPLDEEGQPDEPARTGSVDEIMPQRVHDPFDPESITKTGEILLYAFYSAVSPETIPSTDPSLLRGAECRANAALVLQRLEYRAAHLWPVVFDAVIRKKTMAEIGAAFGGNSQSAPSIGRALVVAGLRFCQLVLAAIAREEGYALGGTGCFFADLDADG